LRLSYTPKALAELETSWGASPRTINTVTLQHDRASPISVLQDLVADLLMRDAGPRVDESFGDCGLPSEALGVLDGHVELLGDRFAAERDRQAADSTRAVPRR
jgi:hypothetical protein